MKVSATFAIQLLNNHTTKMAKFSIEINGNLHFSHIWHDETSDVKNLSFQIKQLSYSIFSIFNLDFDQIRSVILSPKRFMVY